MKCMKLIKCLTVVLVSFAAFAVAADEDVSVANQTYTSTDNGVVRTLSFGYMEMFDYRTEQGFLSGDWDAQGGAYSLLYNQSDYDGNGWFANFTYAPDIDLEGEAESVKIDAEMERYDIEAGLSYPDFFGLEDIYGTVGIKYTYVDRDYEVTGFDMFDQQTNYGGIFLGAGSGDALFDSDKWSWFWNAQVMALYASQDAATSGGYELESENSIGIGTNGSIGISYSINDDVSIIGAYKGQYMEAGSVRDSFKAWYAQLHFSF